MEQYAVDNVDHNVCSIDGNNTFHGMGIATVTPAVQNRNLIPRHRVTSENIAAVGSVRIHYFNSDCSALEWMAYDKLQQKLQANTSPNLHLVWKASLLFGTPRPAWLGFMQMVHHDPHPGKSSVMFLPMMDMNPSDVTCILATLHFICAHAKKYNVTPVVTSDQPLWWKANLIVQIEPEQSDVRSVASGWLPHRNEFFREHWTPHRGVGTSRSP